MIQHVPKNFRTDGDLQSLFETRYPATSVQIGRQVGNLPELVQRHNEAVCQLESYLVMYLKDGKIGKKRPTIRRGGFMGIGGKKLDAIDHWTYVPLARSGSWSNTYAIMGGSSAVKSAEEAVEKARSEIDFRKAENYGTLMSECNPPGVFDHSCCVGFASMGAVAHAHIVAKMLEGKPQRGAEISLAPNPKDIVRPLAGMHAIKSTKIIASYGRIWYNQTQDMHLVN